MAIVAPGLYISAASAETKATVAENQQAIAETKQVMADGWITTQVKSEILADSASKGYTVHVKTTQGTVALKGALANESAIAHIKAIAGKVQGVRSVDTTELMVEKPKK